MNFKSHFIPVLDKFQFVVTLEFPTLGEFSCQSGGVDNLENFPPFHK